MSKAVALEFPEYQGLTHFETKLATALIHSRYRSSFSSLHPRKADDGSFVLDVWGRTPSDQPAFSLMSQEESMVAVSERKGLVASADSVQDLVAKISSELPPPLPF